MAHDDSNLVKELANDNVPSKEIKLDVISVSFSKTESTFTIPTNIKNRFLLLFCFYLASNFNTILRNPFYYIVLFILILVRLGIGIEDIVRLSSALVSLSSS